MTNKNYLSGSQRAHRSLKACCTSVVVFLFIFALGLPGSAAALAVTHVFGGVVTQTAEGLEFSDSVGTRFEYSVTYDTDLSRNDVTSGVGDTASTESIYFPDIVPLDPSAPIDPSAISDTLVEFVDTPMTFEFRLGAQIIDILEAPVTPLRFGDASALSFLSTIGVRNDDFLNVLQPSVDSLRLRHVFLLDSSGTAFSDRSLPTSLQLADFDDAQVRFISTIGPNLTPTITFVGTIDMIESTVVPEPGTGLLVGLGLACLVARKFSSSDPESRRPVGQASNSVL